MNNTDIENKIKEISTDYIYNQAVGCLLLLLMSYEETLSKDKEEFKIPFKIHNDILEIRKTVTDGLLNLETNLNLKNEERIKFTDMYIETSNKIIPIYKSILNYINAFSIPFTLISDEFLIRKYNDEFPQNTEPDFSKIYDDCKNILENTETEIEKKLLMCQLLKCTPLRMTKEKIYSLIEGGLFNGISQETEENAKISLEIFKNACAPQTASTYGKYFAEIAEIIKKGYNINPSDLSDNELDTIFEDYKATMDTLMDIADYIKDLYNDIDSLIIIFFSGFSFDDITQNEFACKDLYYIICSMISNNEDSAIYSETTGKLLEKYFEPIIDKLNKLNKKEQKLLKTGINLNELSEDTTKLILAQNFIRNVYYTDLDDKIYSLKHDENDTLCSEEFKKDAIYKFLDEIKAYYETLNTKQRKLSMLTLLSSLPIMIDTNEFIDYISLSLKNSPSLGTKALIIEKIGQVLKENGFIDFEEDECNSEHHHHHDHDCDCGYEHHHHHDHDCDCGCEHNHH